ncbi:MAG: Undecaprenyl-phosphate 4-deoxy-4-formamido-L-arabinose transferase [Candidatus Celerinatantimonas neptuna]|nr:MAG: Undecaprenyl-phosphate 4-deoxy-4-formamido-L-arabinose transferase [Candidatus Celerinatantimonas neptuna]
MKLSLIIPAYNEENYLGHCLYNASLELAVDKYSDQFEIIVVDNASSDRTAQIAAEFRAVRVVHEERKGLTFARQKGFEAARGEIVAYIDADTHMPAGWLSRVLAAYERSERLVCISGPYHYYDLPMIQRLLVWLYWNLLARPVYWMTGYMAVGGNFAARRDALEKIGGFDTSISFYGEDTNIARRLSKQGKVYFDMRLVMATSARRLIEEGLMATGMKYVVNFFSEVIRKKPVPLDYHDIR